MCIVSLRTILENLLIYLFEDNWNQYLNLKEDIKINCSIESKEKGEKNPSKGDI